MGEAKRRGAFDERKAASQNNAGVLRAIDQGDAPHYAFILDRSATGRKALAEMKRGPEEIQARVNGEAMKLWETSPQFSLVVIWGTWGYSGGLTIPTANANLLLEEVLPKVMERTLEKGGLCTFMPLIDESLVESVTGRLAQLQPTAGLGSN
ncbi:hypothetical protein R70006_05055 [Paraburkholderia domus]|uniref:hypothetical protein n=1 Tax=Paraburkholderia domus TaxID=2793075 RepID=UPI0019144910|nr:hypothetical protein [Paraburkholderia domus]MBK5051708.1 hypothetical protein [Burkholderia sp. R-70006]CAE6795552.1 hypothetical protein R70006_05055 [Paraburkholderia domus]